MKKKSIALISLFLVVFVLVLISSVPTLPVQGIPPTVAPAATSGAKYPVADDFNSAIPVTPPFVAATFNGIPTKASDDPIVCGGVPYGGSIWFKYAATSNTPMMVNTADTSYDTVAAVYTGTRGNLTQVACNDDQASVDDETSWVDFNAISGTTYYIMIGQYGGSTPVNNFIHVVISAIGNDEFYTARWVTWSPYSTSTGPFTFSQNINGSTVSSNDISSSCPGVIDDYSNSVWYRGAFSSGYNVTVSTSGSSYDTVLDLFGDSNTSPYLIPLACNDDYGATFQSQLTFTPVASKIYYFRISHYGTTPATSAQTLKLGVVMTANSNPPAVKINSSQPNVSQPAQTPTFIPPTPHP